MFGLLACNPRGAISLEILFNCLPFSSSSKSQQKKNKKWKELKQQQLAKWRDGNTICQNVLFIIITHTVYMKHLRDGTKSKNNNKITRYYLSFVWLVILLLLFLLLLLLLIFKCPHQAKDMYT